MLGYFKRVGEPSSKDAASKRPRVGIAAADNASADPLTIVTWNANGLGVRLRKDWEAFKEFLTSHNPDVCCIQEVRLAAAGLPKCKKDDNTARRRGELKADTTADRKDREEFEKLKSLARRLGYRVVLSLANSKYAGTAALIRNTCPASDIYYNVTPEGLSKEHDVEGRVIALEFRSFTLVILYVPNNGVKEESFRRREAWDANMRAFVSGYGRPLIVCGDLNVSHTDADLTHPSFFKRMCPSSEPKNSGQPGCTPAEQERHSQLLECGGGLVDSYRQLHPAPTGSLEGGTDTPGITWRGLAGNDVPEMGKFYGKGMRIDYFLLSKCLADRVGEVLVFGRGADRDGFLGSDHCPVLLRLRVNTTTSDNQAKGTSSSSSSSSR